MKATLTIDMPKSCSECKLSNCDVQFRGETYTCPLVRGADKHRNDIHPQCPLQPISLDNDVEEAITKLNSLAKMRDNDKRGISPAYQADNLSHTIKAHIQKQDTKLNAIKEIAFQHKHSDARKMSDIEKLLLEE